MSPKVYERLKGHLLAVAMQIVPDGEFLLPAKIKLWERTTPKPETIIKLIILHLNKGELSR